MSMRLAPAPKVAVAEGDLVVIEDSGVEDDDKLEFGQKLVNWQDEALTIRNLCKMIETGSRYGIPTLGVTAVGTELTRDARYLGMASRVLAENGAQVVKTYYCDEGFEREHCSQGAGSVREGNTQNFRLADLNTNTSKYFAGVVRLGGYQSQDSMFHRIHYGHGNDINLSLGQFVQYLG